MSNPLRSVGVTELETVTLDTVVCGGSKGKHNWMYVMYVYIYIYIYTYIHT